MKIIKSIKSGFKNIIEKRKLKSRDDELLELGAKEAAWLVSATAYLVKKPAPDASLISKAVNMLELSRILGEYGVCLERVSVSQLMDETESAINDRFILLKKIEHGYPSDNSDDCENASNSNENTLQAPSNYSISLIMGRQDSAYHLFSQKLGSFKVPVSEIQLEADLIYKLQVKEVLPQEEAEKFGWKWFAKAFFKRKKVIRDVLLGSFVVQLIGLAYPLATQAIVDKVIQNQAVNTLIALGIGIGLFAVFNGILSWIRQKFLIRMANLIDAELAGNILSHLLRLPVRYFEARTTGVIINRVHGVDRVRSFFAGAFTLVALDLPFALLFLVLMFTYSWKLTLLVGCFVAILLITSFLIGPKLRDMINTQSLLGAKVQGYLTEHVSAQETIKSLQMEPVVQGRFNEINKAYLEATRKTSELGNSYGSFMQVAEQLMNASVLCFGAYLAMTSTELTIGMLVAFQMFAQRVSQPLLKLSSTWQELQQVRVAVSQLGDLMNTDIERYSSLATSVSPAKGNLEVIGLGFTHNPDLPLLYENLSFEVKSGSIVLVTGASGSGKSTLAKILIGMYGFYKGTVKIDGRDIKSMSINEIRNFYGVVPQETVLFSGTILENLLNVSPASSIEDVSNACKLAGVHSVIENLPKGYLTEIGERGVGLSGGQRQRIGIARALLKRPRLFIFDEATSSLDDESAELIAQTVNQFKGKATVLFIAHKIPKNLKYDRHVELSK